MSDEDDVLPFTLSEPDENTGVGEYRVICDLARFAGEDDDRPEEAPGVIEDGRCFYCGYDRGVTSWHTEVAGQSVECHNCGHTVYREEP